MSFDFSKEYARYSNVELLRIVLQPEKYQPAAVDVAQDILSTRTVTEEDQLQAREILVPKPRKVKPGITDDSDWQKNEGIFGSSGIPDFTGQRTWLVLAVTLALLTVDNVYTQILALLRQSPYMDVYLNLAIFGLQCVACYFFLYKKRLGWILSASWVCYMLCTKLLSLSVLVNYVYSGVFSMIPNAFYEVIAELILLTLSITLLCRPGIRSAYAISRETMIRTFVISTGVTVLYCITVTTVYYLMR